MVAALCAMAQLLFAQEMPAEMSAAIKADDSVKLATLITKENISTCYQEGSWQYSPLSQTVRHNAMKCFNLLIALGADVNKACGGYVPEYTPADGETPLTYAQKNNQTAVADFLRTVQNK